MSDFHATWGRKTAIAVVAVLGAFLAFVFGFHVGVNDRSEVEKVLDLSNKTNETIINTADFSPFWKTWNLINEKSPKGKEVTNEKKLYGAISGLVGSLDDPYSVFFDPEETRMFEETLEGNFDGIGMEVGMKDDTLTVIAPLKDTPAFRAKVKPGDKVLKIDSKPTSGLSIEEAIKLIRGKKGTTVVLTIFREGNKEPLELKIVRDTIKIPTLDTELRPDGIFVIKLYSFTGDSHILFREAMKKFADARTEKMLLDLRGNPGGFLEVAVDMASWFLPEGKVVVTEDYKNDKKPEIFRSKGYNIFTDKLKFVILINEGSASASEILAGAMQDYKKAVLVGEKSFGKGSVQETVEVTKDTILKITVANWLTPGGNTIAEKGLTPDFEVKMSGKDEDNQVDPQMDKAIKILLESQSS